MKYKKFATKIRPYIMTAPALAGILLFTIYPIIKLIQLSLMNTNMLNPSESRFIGLDNYRKVLSRPDFHKSLNNTVVYTIAVVLIITAIALLLAVWLSEKKFKAEPAGTGRRLLSPCGIHCIHRSDMALDDGTEFRTV